VDAPTQNGNVPENRAAQRRTALLAIAAAGAVAVLVSLAVAGAFDRIPLLSPALAVTVELLAALALAGSWISRRRGWLTRWLPAIVLSAAALTGLAAAVLRLTGTIVDAYPLSFALWVGLVIAAVVGAPLAIAEPGRPRRWAAAAAVPLTLSGALLLINDEYGVWPTAGDLLGHTAVFHAPTLRRLPATVRPDHGVVVAFDAPATVSHFTHRPGSAYLPPAYFTPAGSRLPVIIMLAGTPGGTVQWPTSGRAISTTDAYAATHHGLAPILVFVDENGSATGDTECVNGPHGNAETYLTVDVPAFVTQHLGVRQVADRWAVAGFSEGGTCALDLTLVHPNLFHHFVDLAGDDRPTLGNPQRNRTVLFGGSAIALRDHDPDHLLLAHRYRAVSCWFAAGVNDNRHLMGARRLALEASRAGLRVHLFTGVSGHNWQFASAAFAQVLPSLCTELGLTGATH
jgi:S-formylglutathione hydrolase FrmB